MMLYLIHPYHRDDRGCWRMSGTVIELACFPDVERPDSHRRVSSRISTADWTAWGFKERTSLSFWVILDHLGPFWDIWGHIWATLGHLGSFFTSASILSPNRQQISPIRKTTRDKISISSTKEWGGLQAAQCIAWRTDLIGYKTTRLQSMGITGGTGNIFTNYHLFVLHADI